MANKNIVKHAKTNVIIGIIALVALGWLLSLTGIMQDTDKEKQEQLIASAQPLLEDGLYVPAARKYAAALAYQTENNTEIENKLVQIYKDGGVTAEYVELVRKRIETGTAKEQEYIDLANFYLTSGSTANAISLLGIAQKVYPDNEEICALAEENRYALSVKTLGFSDVKIYTEDGYMTASNGEKAGYLSDDGHDIQVFMYDEAFGYSGNYAVVKKDGQYSLIDKNGYKNGIDKNELEQVVSFTGTYLVGVKDGRYGIYTYTFLKESNTDTKEENVYLSGNGSFENVYLSENGLFFVQMDGKWILLDKNFEPVTDKQFLDVKANQEGFAFSKGYAVVADEKGYYVINEKGEEFSDVRFTDAKGVENGYVAVADVSGKWGFANCDGTMIIDYQYEDAYSFSGKVAAVKYLGKWGYINRYNMLVIENQYETVTPFVGRNAIATDQIGNTMLLTLKFYDYF